MYYAGEFRSIDTSQDPRGSLYKVIIFTGYDPSTPNSETLFGDTSTITGPYPTKSVRVNPSGATPIYYNIPDNASELVMTDHPVIINYVGDGKLQKPYRCSTASISFLQSNLNTDFINSLGQRVLVYVLKWKNEVVLQNDITYLNTITNQTLAKTIKIYFDSSLLRPNVYYNDFIPWEKDNFCYDVVWAGFSTPEMLNTAFDHIVDKFTLNCQDALSTLKYTKYTRTGQMESILETLFRGLTTLGIYRNVYITSNVHFAAATDDFWAEVPTTGPAIRWMAHQQDNFFDEDGIPMYYLDIFGYMMQYLGLTMIPQGDSLYITNDHCIGNGHTSYRKYSFDTGNFLWTIPALNPTYDAGVDIDRQNTIMLNAEKFCSSSTSLSSDVMINKVAVECDEMRPDPMLPDFDDDKNYKPEIASQNQPLACNLAYVVGNTSTHYHYLEMYLNRVADDITDIKFLCYPQITKDARANWSTTNAHETNDTDLVVSHNLRYAGAGGNGPWPDWVYGIMAPPSSSGAGDEGKPSCMACMIDYADTQVSSLTEIPTSFSLKRGILLATPANNVAHRYADSLMAEPHDWDDKSTYWNPMLYLKSKPFLGNGKQYLNLNATFTYYGQTYPDCTSWYPCKMDEGDSYFKFSSSYNYVWMKIKLGNQYLTDNGRGSYSWTSTESFVRIWFDNSGVANGSQYLWTSFNMESTVRGVDGISVELPVLEGFAAPYQLEIWVDRPLGPGSQDSRCASSTVIDNFEVNIFSDEYVTSRKRRNPDRNNTRYENDVDNRAIEEGDVITLIHSSTDTAGLSYAETALRTNQNLGGNYVYRTNPSVLNDGSGYYGVPEKVRVDTDKHQYTTPTIKVETGVFLKDLNMYSRVLWESQLQGHKFIIDSMEADIEYEQCAITLLEVKAPGSSYSDISRMNATRNYYRTQDIIFGGHVAVRNPVLIVVTPATGNSIDYMGEPLVTLTTGEDAAGASSFNMDWATGQFRLTTPYGGSISATVNNNRVVVTTE